jgi:hypothetical protein
MYACQSRTETVYVCVQTGEHSREEWFQCSAFLRMLRSGVYRAKKKSGSLTCIYTALVVHV